MSGIIKSMFGVLGIDETETFVIKEPMSAEEAMNKMKKEKLNEVIFFNKEKHSAKQFMYRIEKDIFGLAPMRD